MESADAQSRITRMFREVLDRPPEQRQAYITTISGDDPGVRAALEHLLEFSPDSPTVFLDSPVPSRDLQIVSRFTTRASLDAVEQLLASDDLSGYRFGPYKLLQRIGKGGMGYVYLAERADQEYRKLVAVKLVKPGMQTEQIVLRFRQERQVLARLDHPNMARLLDGGTERGLPYIVMEYVEGTPIDAYCKAQRLPFADRLKLFLTVCSAVQFAHQNLVVHRDIKPSNILVTNERVPKLLDFGIAKVLNPEQDDDRAVTNANERPMTPDYASPEQVRGEPITTASDVYALGLLLYELLTTEHPIRRALMRHGYNRKALTIEAEPPSTAVTTLEPEAGIPEDAARLRTLLRGDLDAIILKALRQEPSERYASVQQFADDVQSFLDGKPVGAHRDSFSYRARKFVRRNAAGVIAASVAIIALLTSSIVSWIFYYEANHQQKRAEARFSDVRQLARFVLFDFDNIIKEGQTPARRAVLEKATEYLARLEKDRGRDPSIETELVDGYMKIGDVQGNLFNANLGDPKAAINSYRHAITLLDNSRNADPVQSAEARRRLADMLMSQGGPASSAAIYEEARKALAGVADRDPRARKRLPGVLGKLGLVYKQLGDLSGTLRSFEAMQVAARAALADDPNSADAKRQLATAQVCAGDARARLSGPDAGLPDMRRGLEALSEMAKSAPNSTILLRTVESASGWIGDVLVLAKRYPEATTYFRSALDVADKLSSLDAHNAQYTQDRINYLGRLADAQAAAGNREEARRLTRQLLASLKPMASEPDASEFELYQYAWTLVNTTFPEFQNWSEAERTAKRLVTSTQSKDASSLDVLARAYAGQRKYDDARQTEERALALLPRQRSPLRTELEANLQRFTAQRGGVGTKLQP